MQIMTDQGGLLARIEASRRALAGMLEAAAVEMARRDELIRQAIDEGTAYRAVANAAGITAGGVAKVMSKPPPAAGA